MWSKNSKMLAMKCNRSQELGSMKNQKCRILQNNPNFTITLIIKTLTICDDTSLFRECKLNNAKYSRCLRDKKSPKMFGAGKDMLLSAASQGLEGFTPSNDMLIFKSFLMINIEKQNYIAKLS